MALGRATKPPGAYGRPPGPSGRVHDAADDVPPGYTGSIRCAHCQTVAAVTRKFCGSCGTALWQPCHQCGVVNAAEEKFCGACGADLVAGVQEQFARFEENLERAGQLHGQCRFEEALTLVGPIAKATHPRFSEQAARAAQTIKQCLADRVAWHARATLLETEAGASLERLDFETAVSRLESIPAAIRGEAAARLLAEARSRLEEIQLLSAEIDAASGSALSTDLLAKVGRLLALRPDHAGGRHMAARFCQRLCQVAQTRLAECRYPEVVKVLDRIPEALRTDVVRAVRDKASELALLAWDLQNSPVVDAPLVKLALRFRQLAPHDRQMAPLCYEILDRAKDIAVSPGQQTGISAPPATFVPWRTLPEPGPLGCPVVWESGPEQIGLDAKLDPALLRENPGCFAVACGLALQGLQRAAISVNLLPDETPLWLKIARWGPKRRPRSAWGIDLGSGSLKAVKLVLDQDQPGDVAIQACDLVEHKKILSQAGDEERKSLVDETLRTFIDRNNADGDRICLGLPAGMLLLHRLEMPPMEPAKLDAAVAFEARTALPVPLDDLAWQYVILNQDEAAGAAAGSEKFDIMVVGVRRVLLADRLARFESAGLRVDEVQSDCLALHNYVVHNHFGTAGSGRPPDRDHPADGARAGSGDPRQSAAAPGDDRPLAILDIGADATNFIVSSPRSVWLRSVGMGMDRVNKALVREFRITFAQAEQWKRDPASAPNVGRLFETLQPVYDDFFQEAGSSLQAFALSHPGPKIQRILGLGGGFRLHGLFRYLRLGR